jgi:diguanylate cyclase (GGDEF)-like protein/PAS domain S-box-containing protein
MSKPPLLSRISLRQAAYAAACAVILSIAFSIVEIGADYLEHEQEQQRAVEQVLQTLYEPALLAAYELNERNARNVVDSALVHPAAYEARLLTDFGEVLAAKSRSQGQQRLAGLLARALPTRHSHVQDLVLPESGKLIGRLEVSLDSAAVNEPFLRRAVAIVALEFLRNLILALLLGVVVYVSLTRPLVAISRRVARADPAQPRSAVVGDIRRDDEIGDLVTALNRFFASSQQHLGERDAAHAALRESEERYRQIIETTDEGVWLIDADNKTRFVNAQMAAMLGCRVEDMLGRSMFEFMDEAGRAIAAVNVERRRAGIRERYEFRFLRRDGSPLWTELSAGPVVGTDGEYRGALAMVTDISDRKRTEEQLRLANEKLIASVAQLQTRERAMTLVGQMNDVLQSCHSFEESFQVIERAAHELFAPQGGCLAVLGPSGTYLETVARWGSGCAVESVFPLSDCWAIRRGRSHQVCDPAGEPVCSHFTTAPMAGYVCIPLVVRGELLGLLHLATAPEADDVAESSRRRLVDMFSEAIKLGLSNLKLRDALRRQATHDLVTGLFNRHYLDETLPRELHRAHREAIPICVVMVDIDHFKRFNDSHGHDAGDLVLRQVGNILDASLRKSDIACRFGGEEFACILPDSTLADARERFEQISREIGSLRLKMGERVLDPVTVSVGIAQAPEHGDTADELLHAADMALYEAKQAGRNRIVDYKKRPRHGKATEIAGTG